MTYRQKEAGQALILTVLGITVMIGALGLGIDMGMYRFQKRQLQTAADAAALAGAQGYLKAPSWVNQSATQALNSNGYGASSGTTASINNPPTCTTSAPCNLPAADPNNGKANYVEVVLTQNQPTYFSKIFGVTSVPLTARAEAEANNNCIYTLSQAGAGLTMFLAVVTTDCGIVDESATKPGAFDCLGGFLSTPSLEMVGTPNSFFCFNAAKPRTGITLPSKPYDPMKYLQSIEPAVTPCGTTTASPFTGSTSALNITSANYPAMSSATPLILNPGVYCGGITFGAGAYATLTGGTYVFTGTPGGMTFNPLIGRVDGSAGVMIYLNSGSLKFNFSSFTFSNGGITLTAANSGQYAGILFFQPPTNASPAQVVGSFTFGQTLTGGYYMPGANLTYVFDFVTSAPGEYAPIVVNQLAFGFSGFSGTPNVNIFNRPPTGVSPLASSAAVLVE